MGEIREVKTESVTLDNYINQYAVIELVQEYGDNQFIPCSDCVCNITVILNDVPIVSDAPMVDRGNALMGYNATSPLFLEYLNYHCIVNCTSIIYNGSGLAYSDVTILPGLGSNQAVCGSYDLVCNSQNIISSLTSVLTRPSDNSWLKQIYQVLEDTSMANTGSQDVCQLVMANSTSFEFVELNRHSFVTEYTYDEYLKPGTYFWRVRCKRATEWGLWSDLGNFTHTTNPVYFDWTVK